MPNFMPNCHGCPFRTGEKCRLSPKSTVVYMVKLLSICSPNSGKPQMQNLGKLGVLTTCDYYAPTQASTEIHLVITFGTNSLVSSRKFDLREHSSMLYGSICFTLNELVHTFLFLFFLFYFLKYFLSDRGVGST